VAMRVGGERLVVANVNKDKYPETSFTTDPSQASFVPMLCLATFCAFWHHSCRFWPRSCFVMQQEVYAQLLTCCLKALGYPFTAGSQLNAVGIGLQDVDTAHHSWANYFLAAYKVHLFPFHLHTHASLPSSIWSYFTFLYRVYGHTLSVMTSPFLQVRQVGVGPLLPVMHARWSSTH
jgi:hypothetical protein